MVDFLMISTKSTKRGYLEIYPKFVIKNPSHDLMIRGGDFYAVWDEEKGLWSTSEQDVIDIIDRALDQFAEENRQKFDANVKIAHMWDAESGMIDKWHKYCQRQMRDSFHMLDEKLIFSNSPVNKKDYASKRLNYPLEAGDTSAYDKLMSVLYSDEERRKIEWAIGSVVSGDSKKLQKFLVLYGAAGTGKSTVLNIIQDLFDGYFAVFDAKALGSSNNAFALEAFKSNPLVAIQHDGDLSKIEDNTRLNSLVSHEKMTVNSKFEKLYSTAFKSFLFMGTNKPVKITDAKSGLLRRLIDVRPTGNLVSGKEYKELTNKIQFELGAIASHCKDVYEQNKDLYDNYIPLHMMSASNDFYNFIVDSYHIFKKEDSTTLAQAWAMYQEYCSTSKVPYPMSRRAFKEELKNYFTEFHERFDLDDGGRVRSLYNGFRNDIFDDQYGKKRKKEAPKTHDGWLTFDSDISKSDFDKQFADCPAQYANGYGNPKAKWANVKTTLKDLDTTQLHYMQGPPSLVTIDFDIPGEDGNKSFEKNVEAASKWPPTYAELSKSGAGIHLEYIYTGDPNMIDTLSEKLPKHVEIKIFKGNAALRRKLTRCNGLPISTINSGLPQKERSIQVVDFKAIKTEAKLKEMIENCLEKKYPPGSTKSSCDFIFKLLEDAYNDGLKYDLTTMRQRVLNFASNSTHQSEYCVKLVSKMKFKSEDQSLAAQAEMDKMIFFDIEVYPNVLMVNWKVAEDVDWVKVSKMNESERLLYFVDLIKNHKKPIVKMFNPSADDIENLVKYKLAGYNCRRYDNHILYGRMMGYSNDECYNLSKNIIAGGKNCFFGNAYNLSEIDIYDMVSKKQSLKKYEIEYGFTHKEMSYDWNQPLPEDKWDEVSAYCDNDVLATELVFLMRHADFVAREILADVAGMTINDTTNSLTTRIIFGTDRNPQAQFNYRDMGAIDDKELDSPPSLDVDTKYTLFQNGKPVFPGYSFDKGVSTYRGEEVGEGGYVYSEPGMYYNVALLDIASMHPSSIVAEELFGKEYTKRFNDILQARILIKHKEFDKAKKMLGGKLAKYLDDESVAKDLAQALKIAINSVYGLTSATFDNPFRDNRNRDNIVAKRGALFMINLKHEVQARGYSVAHIKTDSIKIPNADAKIIKFVTDYGKLYGYNFEHEATYDRMCLVNDAVYICKYDDGHWSATGTQFAVPYVFKTLFSHEPLEFRDMCETKSVSTSLYLDMNECMPDVSDLEKKLSDLESKYKKGELSDTTFEKETAGLSDEIAKGHCYIFVGKVGSFCPIKPGCGGGRLLREKDGKYYAATGSKGYRWLEAEVVKTLNKQDDIDERYYRDLVEEAIATISEYGDFNGFV